ncbi:hypothetical protein J6590_075203 [Homalodisca vitripennis]|nr:hypothetical protein J6590_075203 [Homalodisca vitripennis]
MLQEGICLVLTISKDFKRLDSRCRATHNVFYPITIGRLSIRLVEQTYFTRNSRDQELPALDRSYGLLCCH